MADNKSKEQQAREAKAQKLWDDLADTAEDLEDIAAAPKSKEDSKDKWDRLGKISRQFKELVDKISLLEKDQQKEFANSLEDIKAAYTKTAQSDSKLALNELADNIKKASKSFKEQVPFYKRLQYSIDKNKVDGDERDGKGGIFSLRKWAKRASGLTGAKEDLAGFVDRLKEKPGEAYSKAIEKLLQMAEGNKTATKIVKSIDNVARSVKIAGAESIKWLGKKMKDLTFMLWRFIKTPFKMVGAGADLLGKLLPLALLAPYIKTALEELDKELKAKYGEDYVKVLLKKLWDEAMETASKAWTWLKEVSKELYTKISAYLSEAWKGVETWVGKTWGELKAFFTEKLDYVAGLVGKVIDFVMPKELKKESVGTMMGAKETNPQSPNFGKEKSVEQIIQQKLEAYNSKKPGPQKMAAKTNLQNVILEEAPAKSLSLELVGKLRNAGFKVPDEKVVVTAAPVPNSAGEPIAAAPVREQAAEGVATPVTGSVGTSPQAVATPTETTSQTSAITATPSGGAAQPEPAATTATPVKTSMSGGLSSRAIPTHAGDDTLNLLNGGSWGLT